MNANAIVLVLDVEFRPLRVEHWRKVAKKLNIEGKVEVIEYSRDRTIRSVHQEHPMPSVIRILRWFRRDRLAIKFSRLNIYARDAFTCQYCWKQLPAEDLTFDHVIPRSRGGRTNWTNIIACCVDCNMTKANRTPEEAGMRLLRKPVKPRWLPAITVAMNRQVPPEWAPYWSGSLEP